MKRGLLLIAGILLTYNIQADSTDKTINLIITTLNEFSICQHSAVASMNADMASADKLLQAHTFLPYGVVEHANMDRKQWLSDPVCPQHMHMIPYHVHYRTEL